MPKLPRNDTLQGVRPSLFHNSKPLILADAPEDDAFVALYYGQLKVEIMHVSFYLEHCHGVSGASVVTTQATMKVKKGCANQTFSIFNHFGTFVETNKSLRVKCWVGNDEIAEITTMGNSYQECLSPLEWGCVNYEVYKDI